MKGGLAEEAGSALFWKALLQGGTHLIYLLRLLILARILVPEDFGLLAIAMTGIGFSLRLTDLGMQPALVQRPSLTDQHYNTAWTIGVLRAIIIGAGIFFTAPLLGNLFAEPSAVDIIRTLALLPALDALASIKIVDLIRKLHFRSLGIAKLVEALANTIISIALAPILGVWALVIGTLLGPLGYAIVSYILAPYRPRFSWDRDAARSLIRYGQWIFVTGLVAVSGGALLRLIISRELGAAELGIYFLAAKLAFLPNEIASEVVGAVSFPVYARVQSNISQATRTFRAIFTSMFLVLTPVFTLMLVLAPSIVKYVLGSHWEGAELLIRLLALVGLLGLTGDAAVPVLKGLGHPQIYALLEGGQSLCLVIFAWIFINQFGLIGTAYAWAVATLPTLLITVLFIRKDLSLYFSDVWKPLFAILLSSGSGGFLALYLQNAFQGLFGLFVAAVFATGCSGAILLLLNKSWELNLTRDFAKVFPKAAPLLASLE
jgi:O-antigen/teichoic acid export membrane protein